MSIHEEAARYGIRRPALEHYEYEEGSIIVIALTPESDYAWGEYLRNITLAKIALNSTIE